MSPDTLFSICSALVLPGWALLVFLPRWRGTSLVSGSCAIPLALAFIYTILMSIYLPSADGGFNSLDEVAALMGRREILLAGWIHYLCFDLFIGGWEVRDSQALGIPHLLVVPCLVLTFLAGPAGLLAYFLLRWSMRRKFLVAAEAAR